MLASGYVVGAIAILQSAFGLLGGGYFLGASGVIRADVTLANPDVVDLIRRQVQGEGPVVLKEGPEDVKQFGANE